MPDPAPERGGPIDGGEVNPGNLDFLHLQHRGQRTDFFPIRIFVGDCQIKNVPVDSRLR